MPNTAVSLLFDSGRVSGGFGVTISLLRIQTGMDVLKVLEELEVYVTLDRGNLGGSVATVRLHVL